MFHRVPAIRPLENRSKVERVLHFNRVDHLRSRVLLVDHRRSKVQVVDPRRFRARMDHPNSSTVQVDHHTSSMDQMGLPDSQVQADLDFMALMNHISKKTSFIMNLLSMVLGSHGSEAPGIRLIAMHHGMIDVVVHRHLKGVVIHHFEVGVVHLLTAPEDQDLAPADEVHSRWMMVHRLVVEVGLMRGCHGLRTEKSFVVMMVLEVGVSAG